MCEVCEKRCEESKQENQLGEGEKSSYGELECVRLIGLRHTIRRILRNKLLLLRLDTI